MLGRILAPFIVGLGFALLLGWPLILFLRRFKARQAISTDAPQRHQAKAGTPTMGGLIILSGGLVASLLGTEWSPGLLAALALTAGYTGIGFLDDFLIVRRGKNLGLKARQKLLGQFAFAIAFVWWYHASAPPLPAFLGAAPAPWLRFAWQAFQVLLVVGMSNAVNLTDGLDGLAAGVSLPVWLALALLADPRFYPANLADGAARGDFGAAALAAGFAGATLGYLWFNAHPAQVFMGDTGSLPIGAAMAAAAILLRQEWALLLAGMVHVIEAGSVTAQVISFKTTGRRIFRMSPLHHHFELAGWPETRVVTRFAVVSALCAAVALLLALGWS